MELLEGTLRAYPWGSRTLIQEMRGLDSPASRPEAEVWFGAHPGAPSTIDGTSLNELIAQNPVGMLGERVAGEFEGQLPFLLRSSQPEPLCRCRRIPPWSRPVRVMPGRMRTALNSMRPIAITAMPTTSRSLLSLSLTSSPWPVSARW